MSAAGADASTSAGAVVPAEEVDRSKHPSGIVPQLQNVVATVDLGCRLELKDIALHARNAEYNPKVLLGLFRPRFTRRCCYSMLRELMLQWLAAVKLSSMLHARPLLAL